jgi:hypothetical protein
MANPDDATICPGCGQRMEPEHAHYRCRFCGYRDTCCDGAPATVSDGAVAAGQD